MRAQVVTQQRPGRGRAGAGKGGAAGVAAQRPAPRRGRSSSSGAASRRQGFSWKGALRFAPLAAKLLLAVVVGVLVFVGYRTAASASFFKVRTVDIEGNARSSRKDIEEVVTGIAGRTGVWRADLETISEEIARLPWVRSAVVTRVLPSGVRVRVTERAPAVIARTQAGRLVWVDDEGVVLGAASPGEDEFFMYGLDEGRGDDARQKNRERVRVAAGLAREWEAASLSRRVSEINLEDLRDVRVQLAGADAHVEVRLGKEDFARRFRQALEVLDAQRGTARGPFVTYIDVSQGKRAVVGTGASAHVPIESSEQQAPAAEPPSAEGAPAVESPARPVATRAAAKRADERKGVKKKTEAGRDRRGAAERRAETTTRPRRVG